jgi:glycosyltransferase involved in cell wall biosynthesis
VISREGTIFNYLQFYKELYGFYYKDYFKSLRCRLYSSYGLEDDEPIFLLFFKHDKVISIDEIFSTFKDNFDNSLAKNINSLDTNELINLYYLYGKYPNGGITKEFLEYRLFSNIYIDRFFQGLESDISLSKDKLLRIIALSCGENDFEFPLNEFQTFSNIAQSDINILLISKTISGYGGNQKTAIQLYHELSSLYNVKVVCLTNEKFTFDIPTIDIVKVNSLNDVVQHISTHSYNLILVNSLNQIESALPSLQNQNIVMITHNCMSQFNSVIFRNRSLIKGVLCVNMATRKKFLDSGLECPISVYKNTIAISEKILARSKFKNKVAFIGRLSPEKNLEILIEAWKVFIKHNNVELLIIGDGSKGSFNSIDNIRYLGYLSREEIINILDTVDYLIVPSITEGLPHVILEAMSIGIPSIVSDINGLNELVFENMTGFKFELQGYSKFSQEIDTGPGFERIISEVRKNNIVNKENLLAALLKAYSINIEEWNLISNNSFNFIKSNYDKSLFKDENLKQISLFLESDLSVELKN